MQFPVEFTRRLVLLASLAASAFLAGCGAGMVTTETSGAYIITGSVHGGIQPIAGASIQLFAVGSSGNGSAATGLLAHPMTTDAHGAFALSGNYTCPAANTQVYLSAHGGNPGFSAAVNNPALVLLTALGNCGDLSRNTNVQINEVTTAAAGYALAQFTAGFDHIGASATNAVGIANAFLDAHLLADPATGLAAQIPSNLTVESPKLYALADALVPCVNSDGGAACTPLFTAATPAGGIAPTDVLGALLNIVRNPGHNVAAVFSTIGSTPPYPTSLSKVPGDWTMSLTVTGGGISQPTGMGLDSQGDVWVTNYGYDSTHPAGLVGYTPQGTPFSGSPFSPSLQTDSYGLTVDKNDDIWVASYDNVQGNGTGSVAKFMGARSTTPGALVRQYQDRSLNWPESIAADPSGNGSILAANYYAGTVTVFNLDGTVARVLGAGLSEQARAAFPAAVTSDDAGGAWTGDQGDNDIVHFLADGSVVKSACCSLVQSVRLDSAGNVWATNFDAVGNPAVYTFSEVAPDGSVRLQQKSGGGIYSPGGAVVDAGGQFWTLNYNSAPGANYSAFSEFAGNSASVPAGTPLSPATGFGLDAKMAESYAAAVDASGNLWMTVRNGNSLRMFFGLATPTAMPATPRPQAP